MTLQQKNMYMSMCVAMDQMSMMMASGRVSLFLSTPDYAQTC